MRNSTVLIILALLLFSYGWLRLEYQEDSDMRTLVFSALQRGTDEQIVEYIKTHLE